MSVTIAVRVTPRSARDEIGGWREGELLVRVTAPPEGGRANAAVSVLIAKALGVPKSSVTVVRGGASRHKSIAIEGLAEGAVRRALGAPE